MLLLVVDDDRDAAETLAELLRLLAPPPVEVWVAFDGEEALAVTAGSRIPDVVVMDLEMPRMGGLGAAVAMKQALNGRTPCLIAVTGRAEMLQRPSVLEAFDHGLIKPLKLNELLRVLPGG